MAITPADIQAQTFSEAKRGYDPAEVDVFLETLSSEAVSYTHLTLPTN